MTRYNKSKIFKLAHHMVKYEELTMSQALTLAWSKARRDDFYQIIEVRKPRRYDANEGSIMHDMNLLAESLTRYYRDNTYNGD
jgi:phage gpG-like protein